MAPKVCKLSPKVEGITKCQKLHNRSHGKAALDNLSVPTYLKSSSSKLGLAAWGAMTMESQTRSSKRAFREVKIGGCKETRRPFANPSQPFANPSPTFRQPFANLSANPSPSPSFVDPRHAFRNAGLTAFWNDLRQRTEI